VPIGLREVPAIPHQICVLEKFGVMRKLRYLAQLGWWASRSPGLEAVVSRETLRLGSRPYGDGGPAEVQAEEGAGQEQPDCSIAWELEAHVTTVLGQVWGISVQVGVFLVVGKDLGSEGVKIAAAVS
jgi:hypothetical protein